MAEVERQLRLLRFENFEVDLRTGELRKAGVKLKFGGQPFQVLSILLEHPGEVVTRDELQKRLWPDTFVDVDHNLNTAINKIREVLGDSAESPRFVETLPRRGYRFIGEVESPTQPVIPPTIPVASVETDDGRHSRQKWLRIAAVMAAIGACAVAAVMFGWLWSVQHRQAKPAPPVKLIPLTSYPGIEQQPSLSPDGSQVAFSWNGPDQTNFDIYVKTTDVKTAGAVPLRLTNDTADDINPAWSPDGSSIAFLRKINPENQFKVLLMPALGGAERYLADVSIPETGWLYPPYLSWMPDSQSLVITDRPSSERPTALYLLSAQTREKRQLTYPPVGVLGDHCAAVSPDGKTLAFRRENNAGQWQGSIYLLGLDNHFEPRGDPRQVTPEAGPAIPNQFFNWSCAAWTADSQRLLFPYDLALWTVPVSVDSANPIRGRATMAVETGNGVDGTTISRISARLAYAFKSRGAESIWRIGIPRPHEKPEPPVRLIPSTASQFGQQYSPDGSRIAFESSLSGNLEIWLCSSEGQNCSQLTSLGAGATGTPTWSPDGKQVAFYSNVEGSSQIYVLPVEGGSTAASHFRPLGRLHSPVVAQRRMGLLLLQKEWQLSNLEGAGKWRPGCSDHAQRRPRLLRIARWQMALFHRRRHRRQPVEGAGRRRRRDTGPALRHALELRHHGRWHLLRNPDRTGLRDRVSPFRYRQDRSDSANPRRLLRIQRVSGPQEDSVHSGNSAEQ